MVLGATALASIALAADIGGTFADGGDTLVSAMMVRDCLNPYPAVQRIEEHVYIGVVDVCG